MNTKNALRYASAATAIIALTTTLILAYSPARAQNPQESASLATFVALTQYIRSQPTTSDIRAAKLTALATLEAVLSNIYITEFITPYTGETPARVTARLQSVPAADRAALVAIYNDTDGPNWSSSTNWLTDNSECSFILALGPVGIILGQRYLKQRLIEVRRHPHLPFPST